MRADGNSGTSGQFAALTDVENLTIANNRIRSFSVGGGTASLVTLVGVTYFAATGNVCDPDGSGGSTYFFNISGATDYGSISGNICPIVSGTLNAGMSHEVFLTGSNYP